MQWRSVETLAQDTTPLPGGMWAGVCSPLCCLRVFREPHIQTRMEWVAKGWGPGQKKCRIQGGKVVLGKATHTGKQHQLLGANTSP